MMEVTVKDQKFEIRWKHLRPNKKNNYEKSFWIGTKCRIDYKKKYSGSGEWDWVFSQTQVHPKDQFCKSIGRKESLKKCLGDFSKEVRKEIWMEYFKHFPIKKETHGREMATK